MERLDEIINYSKSFKGKGMENEELKEIIRLAIIDGAIWADTHPKWTPTDEQMEALYNSIPYDAIDMTKKDMLLHSLYKELEKLKGK